MLVPQDRVNLLFIGRRPTDANEMPYHEFQQPVRLADSEWKSLLDSPQRPALPAWINPIVRTPDTTVTERK
jgi:hypothetical protein